MALKSCFGLTDAVHVGRLTVLNLVLMLTVQAGDDSAEMQQRLKDLGVPIPTGPDAVPSMPSAPMPMGNIIPAPAGPMRGMGQPYPLMPQITVGPTEFLSVNGMVTPDVLVDNDEYKEVLRHSSLHASDSASF